MKVTITVEFKDSPEACSVGERDIVDRILHEEVAHVIWESGRDVVKVETVWEDGK